MKKYNKSYEEIYELMKNKYGHQFLPNDNYRKKLQNIVFDK
jgi:hypothetical protein